MLSTTRGWAFLTITSSALGCAEPVTWTWQAEDPALATKWLETCNKDGPRPGQCPVGSACVIHRYDATYASETGPTVGRPSAWCETVPLAETIVAEVLPKARGEDAVVVVLRMVNTDGEVIAPHVGRAVVTATEPDQHRVEATDVQPDGTATMSLEPGMWHVSINRTSAKFNQEESAAALQDPFPWGLPDGWLQVERSGAVDLEVRSARIRYRLDAWENETLRVHLTSDDGRLDLTVTPVDGEFETPPLGPGPWSAALASGDVAIGAEHPLMPGETAEGTFYVDRRRIDLQMPTPGSDSYRGVTYFLAFGDADTRITTRTDVASRTPDEEPAATRTEAVEVPVGRWRVWSGRSSDREDTQPSGWTRYGDDVELPPLVALAFSEADQAVALSWSDGVLSRDPALIKVFPDGSWSTSPLATPRVWSGTGEIWLSGTCTDQRPGPLYHLGGTFSEHDTVVGSVPVAHVTVRSDLDEELARGTLVQLDAATNAPVAFPGFEPWTRPMAGLQGHCAFLEGEDLVLIPGRYRFNRDGAQWTVDVTASMTLDLSTAPTEAFGIGTDGRMLPDLSPEDFYGTVRLSRVDLDSSPPLSFSPFGAPVVHGPFSGGITATRSCDPATGCFAPAPQVETMLGRYLQMTRTLSP